MLQEFGRTFYLHAHRQDIVQRMQLTWLTFQESLDIELRILTNHSDG